MPTTMAQSLYVSNIFGHPVEVINGARTARRLQSAESCANGTFVDVLDNAGCDALLLQPCTMADDGSTTEWKMMDLLPQAAPWYTGSMASLEAYGFYVEEWTGMDGSHHGRSSTPLGRGGANYGPQSSGQRVMKLNVLLLGETERGLNHLFRWLEDTLLSCCNPCADASMWVREFCPTDPVSDPSEGMARLARVALLEGPTWEAPVTERSGCSIRRASFALGAGDPCLYGEPVMCAETANLTAVGQTFAGNLDVAEDGSFNPTGGAHNCTPYLVEAANFGVLAPKVTISSPIGSVTATGLRKALPDIRISGYTNPGLSGFGPTGAMRKIGELIISGRGTAGLEIVADLAEKTVRYRENTGTVVGGWVDGSRLIGQQIETSLRRWWSLSGCDYGVINVEPVYKSLFNRTEVAVGTQLSYSVTIEFVHRWSCC